MSANKPSFKSKKLGMKHNTIQYDKWTESKLLKVMILQV